MKKHGAPGGSSRLVEDNLRQLYIETGPVKQQTDSGYLSHQTGRPDRQSQSSLLTVELLVSLMLLTEKLLVSLVLITVVLLV